MSGTILLVEKDDELDIWLGFASKVWSTDIDTLRTKFLRHQYPHEFLYWRAGKALAWLSLSLRKEYVEGCSNLPIAYLEGIGVAEEVRQQGIARELLAFARSWAKGQGCLQLASDCALENTLSQEFHARLGFHEVGRSVHYILDLD